MKQQVEQLHNYEPVETDLSLLVTELYLSNMFCGRWNLTNFEKVQSYGRSSNGSQLKLVCNDLFYEYEEREYSTAILRLFSSQYGNRVGPSLVPPETSI